jgi:hypothetical protein
MDFVHLDDFLVMFPPGCRPRLRAIDANNFAVAGMFCDLGCSCFQAWV